MINRSLIAAAGSAGGELSYWVAEVYSSSTTVNTDARAIVNETNQNIIVRTWDSSNQWFYELDFDGGLDDSSTTSNTSMPAGGKGDLVSYGSNTYSVNMSAYSTLRYLGVDDLSLSSFSGKQFTNATTGFSNYPPTKQMMAIDDSEADDRVVLVMGGYYDFGGYYEPRITAWTFNITDDNVDSTITRGFDGNYSGYGVRYPQVAKGASGKFAISYTETGNNRTGFATYTGGATPTIPYVFAPSTANMKNFALRIDENDKLCAVTCVSNQHYFWRGTTAGTYTPNAYYSFNAYSAVGNILSASIDSAGNMYLLGYQGAFDGYRLLKFNTSNTVEWVLELEHNTVSPVSSGEADVNVQSIDDEDFLLISLVFGVENTNQYPVYVIKAPLDFDDFTGTYGHIVVSTVSFSPTVTTNSFVTTNPNFGTTTTATNKSNTTQANSATTASSTVTDID